MFGYILPDKPELKIWEYEIYRAYYCGVCKAIKRNHGNISRLTLNYDTAFLALLLSSLFDEQQVIRDGICMLHPLKKRKIVTDNEVIEYAADMNVLLSWLNLRDKWQDEGSWTALAGMRVLKAAYNKLNRKYPDKCCIILDRLNELIELEKSLCNSIDRAAEPFARLMEEVILYPPVCQDEKNAAILRWMGYNIGKWLYTIDALDDLEKDVLHKAYNPFLYQYNYNGEDIVEFRSRLYRDAEFNLMHTLSEVAKSFELLNFRRYKGIAGNIIYLGMKKKTESILGRGKCL
ncbi:MAG TPA: hypothetical protein GX505_01930 [Clostridiales bacterium]|nr:hypothetical protein [Clostridiales bacterium]